MDLSVLITAITALLAALISAIATLLSILITAVAALLAALIGASATLLAARIQRGKEIRNLESREIANQLEAGKSQPKLLVEDGEAEHLNNIRRLFLVDYNDDNLELHLYKIDQFINQHPNEPDALILKTQIKKALEVKDKKRLIGPPPRHPLHMLVVRFYEWSYLQFRKLLVGKPFPVIRSA